MSSSSVNVGKCRVEEKITPLGIACVVVGLLFLFGFFNPWLMLFLLCAFWLQHRRAFPALMYHADISFPIFLNIFRHHMLSTVSFLWEWVDDDLSMCFSQSYKSLSLSLNISILDILVKAAKVDIVGRGGIREYKGHRTLPLQKLGSAFILFPGRP